MFTAVATFNVRELQTPTLSKAEDLVPYIVRNYANKIGHRHIF